MAWRMCVCFEGSLFQRTAPCCRAGAVAANVQEHVIHAVVCAYSRSFMKEFQSSPPAPAPPEFFASSPLLAPPPTPSLKKSSRSSPPPASMSAQPSDAPAAASPPPGAPLRSSIHGEALICGFEAFLLGLGLGLGVLGCLLSLSSLLFSSLCRRFRRAVTICSCCGGGVVWWCCGGAVGWWCHGVFVVCLWCFCGVVACCAAVQRQLRVPRRGS
mmetsp:Transcript_12359/g.25152  ORF Transcript_12359/g.25152 Transcript_12359/m.25152 type:complete len:214 (-) Transcript_12359:1664-2305(-)